MLLPSRRNRSFGSRRLENYAHLDSRNGQPPRTGKLRVRRPHTILVSQSISCRNLSLGRPDVLEEAVTLSESVQSIVALTHGADETGESIDNVLTLDGPAVLIDLGDGDLARTVVLGLDDAARCRALAGDVTEGEYLRQQSCFARFVAVAVVFKTHRSTISPLSFSMAAACDECC